MPGWAFTPGTLDGVNINDGTTYKSYFEFTDGSMQLLSRMPVEIPNPGDYSFPTVSRAQAESGTLILHIELLNLSQDSLNTLRRACDRYKSEIILTVIDGNAQTWRASVRVTRLVETEPWKFIAMLYMDRPVLESASLSTDVRTITASPSSVDVASAGVVRAYPSFDLAPTAAKANTADYNRRWHVNYAHRSELAGEDSVGNGYPVDIADGTLNTQAEVSAGRMLANGDDLRVLVNNVEYPRLLVGINTTTTKVWVPIHFSPGKQAILSVAMASGSSPASGSGVIDVGEGELADWPECGCFLIENECIWYGQRTDSQFQLIQRGFRGTTAVGHAVDLPIDWVEHEIQIISNYTAAVDPPVPVLAINPTLSTNLAHTYDGGLAAGLAAQRYGQMATKYTEDNTKSPVLSLGESGVLSIADTPAGGNRFPYNNVELYAPCGIKAAASAIAFDILGGDLGVIAPGADVAINARVFGIDIATGVERLLATYTKADRASAAKTITPSAVLQSIRLNALYNVITGAWSGNNILAAGVGTGPDPSQDFDVDSSTAEEVAQSFSLNQQVVVKGAAFIAKEAAGATRDIHAKIMVGTTTSPEGDTFRRSVVVANASFLTTYQWISITAEHFAPAGDLYLVLTGVGAGNPVYVRKWQAIYPLGMWWDEAASVWAKRPEYDMGFLIIGDGSQVQPEAPSGMEGYVGWDNLVFTWDDVTPRTPKIVRGAQETIYIIRGTISNSDTSQSIEIFCPLALSFYSLVIDCKEKTVALDAAKNMYVPNTITPSDPEQWMYLKGTNVATDNTIRYAEASAGGGSSLSWVMSWRDCWA